MLYSANWLQEYYSSKLPKPDKVADFLNMHAFEVEEVKKQKKDTVFNIDVLPNRAHDCLCHVGIAREIAAIQDQKIKTPKTKPLKAQKGNIKPLTVTVESADLVPRYAGIVVEGVTVGKSPKKVQQYLEAVGVNSVNNVVDLTNFVMLEMGQPLHAFDYDKIEGRRMHVRSAKQGEKLQTLDEREFPLPKGTLVIEDKSRLIDLAGIKGGKSTAISQGTKNIFLQAANFQANALYQAKTRLKYTTQAADIYAHEIAPHLATEALERANYLLEEWGMGGKVVQVIDIYGRKAAPKRIALDMAHVEALLGIPISEKQAKDMLQRLGCVVQKKGNMLDVAIPPRRIDLAIPEDLIEEIGRLYGYENIPAVPPAAPVIPPAKNLTLHWQEMVKNSMKELGFTETYTYSFIGRPAEERGLVQLENPVSDEFTHLRDSLVESLGKVVQKNQRKYGTMRIFEAGTVFAKKGAAFQETKMLGAVLLGEEFYAAKGVIDFVLQGLGISNAWYDEYKPAPAKSRPALWHKGKSAEIKIGAREIGFVGEISPALRQNLRISKTLAAFHLNMEVLADLASEEREYQAPSRFPAIVRDIAVLVPLNTKVVDLMNAIHAAGGVLVQDIDLFDMYEGSNLPEGKKNLAFHVVYQADDRTLKGKEVDELHNRVIKAIEQNPEWEGRT